MPTDLHRGGASGALAIPGLELQLERSTGGDRLVVHVAHLAPNRWALLSAEPVGEPGRGVDGSTLVAAVAAGGAGTSPAATLRRASRRLRRSRTAWRATLAVIELDRCGAWVTLACAGRPLPVVVRRAGWVDVRGQLAPPLGAPGGRRAPEVDDDRIGLGPGDAVVIINRAAGDARAGGGERYGEEGLFTTLLAATGEEAAVVAARVVEGAAGGPGAAAVVVRVPESAGDDPERRLQAALGVVDPELLPGYPVGEPDWGRRQRPSPPREARLRVGPDLRGVGEARRFVNGVLHSWRLSELAGGDAELLTSELVTNAFRHGRPPVTVLVRYDGRRVRVEVGDGSRELPAARVVEPEELGGRGVHLVRLLAAGWGTVPTVDGKRVWFEVDASPDVASF